jgi:hypothetical protein
MPGVPWESYRSMRGADGRNHSGRHTWRRLGRRRERLTRI